MNVVRLLLALLLGYIAYRVFRKLLKDSFGWPGGSRAEAPGSKTDTLVQDPVCKTFIPRQDALRLRKNGQDYFFCSEGCLKRFQRQDRENPPTSERSP